MLRMSMCVLCMSSFGRSSAYCSSFVLLFFFFKQKTAYEMRISDWSSDVCSSDLLWERGREPYAGAWSLPGGLLGQDETLEGSIRRHLAAKVEIGRASCRERVCQYV